MGAGPYVRTALLSALSVNFPPRTNQEGSRARGGRARWSDSRALLIERGTRAAHAAPTGGAALGGANLTPAAAEQPGINSLVDAEALLRLRFCHRISELMILYSAHRSQYSNARWPSRWFANSPAAEWMEAVHGTAALQLAAARAFHFPGPRCHCTARVPYYGARASAARGGTRGCAAMSTRVWCTLVDVLSPVRA